MYVPWDNGTEVREFIGVYDYPIAGLIVCSISSLGFLPKYFPAFQNKVCNKNSLINHLQDH